MPCLVSVYKYLFVVMPDLIRHPDAVPVYTGNYYLINTGFRLTDCRNDNREG